MKISAIFYSILYLFFINTNALAGNCWSAGQLMRACKKVQAQDCSWLGREESMLCEGILQKKCDPMMGELYYTCTRTLSGNCLGLSGDSYYFCQAIVD